MNRLPEWRQNLERYIREVRHTPFQPGVMDCCLFTAGAVEAMTGENLMRDFPAYSTLPQGYALLAERGYLSLLDFVSEKFEEIPPASAQPGDIAVVPSEDNIALGIVQGSHVYCYNARLGTCPRSNVIKAFRV